MRYLRSVEAHPNTRICFKSIMFRTEVEEGGDVNVLMPVDSKEF